VSKGSVRRVLALAFMAKFWVGLVSGNINRDIAPRYFLGALRRLIGS